MGESLSLSAEVPNDTNSHKTPDTAGTTSLISAELIDIGWGDRRRGE